MKKSSLHAARGLLSSLFGTGVRIFRAPGQDQRVPAFGLWTYGYRCFGSSKSRRGTLFSSFSFCSDILQKKNRRKQRTEP